MSLEPVMSSEPRLDPVLARKVSRRVEPLVAQLGDRVIQVGDLVIKYPAGVSVEKEAVIPAGPLPSLVLVFQLGMGRIDGHGLRSIASRLDPGARLCFVDPVCGMGLGRGIQRAIATVSRRRWGWDFESDGPAVVRGNGFRVTTVDRFVAEPVAMVYTFAAGLANPRT